VRATRATLCAALPRLACALRMAHAHILPHARASALAITLAHIVNTVSLAHALRRARGSVALWLAAKTRRDVALKQTTWRRR